MTCVMKAEPQPLCQHETAVAERSLRRIRIAVVDDSADFRELICELLLAFDSIDLVGTAGDGAQAIELVKETAPDWLLMDVNMPGIDGVEAANAIARSNPRIFIFLMSADTSPQMRERCRTCAAHGFVAKAELAANLQRLFSYGRRL